MKKVKFNDNVQEFYTWSKEDYNRTKVLNLFQQINLKNIYFPKKINELILFKKEMVVHIDSVKNLKLQ